MRAWKPLMLVMLCLAASLTLFSACGKKEAPEAQPAADTTMVLPDPPELEPLDEGFPESEQESEAVPTKKPQKSNDGLAASGAYTLQVGIYNTERLANRLAEKLKNQGIPAYVTAVEDPKPELPGTYYRVRVGSFHTTKAARAYGEANLAPEGIAFWADLKGRDSRPVQEVFKPRTLPPPTPKPAATPVKAPEAAPADKTAPEPVAPAPTPPAPEPAPEAPKMPSSEPVQDTRPAPKLPDW